jgi:hypothetical protein
VLSIVTLLIGIAPAPLIGLAPISVTLPIVLTPILTAPLIRLVPVSVTPLIVLIDLVLNLTAQPIKSSTYFGIAPCVGPVPDIRYVWTMKGIFPSFVHCIVQQYSTMVALPIILQVLGADPLVRSSVTADFRQFSQ